MSVNVVSHHEQHVVKEAAQVRLVTSAGIIAAKVVKVDAANDLALLKAEERFTVIHVCYSTSTCIVINTRGA